MIVPSACNAAEKGDIARAVLMPGDPLRARYVAETYLQSPRLFNEVRGMLGYTGLYKGRRISVMGSGMGIPSMNLYAHELFHFFEVEAVIRIGSAGGLTDDIRLRDLVIAAAASTNSSIATPRDFPGTLAPCASFDLLRTAAAEAEKKGVRTMVGPVFTSDAFYSELPNANEEYRRLGHLAVEMETAGLYVTAQRAGKKALSILTISDHVFTGAELTAQERQESFGDMMEVALETAWHEA